MPLFRTPCVQKRLRRALTLEDTCFFCIIRDVNAYSNIDIDQVPSITPDAPRAHVLYRIVQRRESEKKGRLIARMIPRKYRAGANKHIKAPGTVTEGGHSCSSLLCPLSLSARDPTVVPESRDGTYLSMYGSVSSCRLIELSSFQFDAEISSGNSDEKSWWLNIEKHARALLRAGLPARFWAGWNCRFVRAFVCRDQSLRLT